MPRLEILARPVNTYTSTETNAVSKLMLSAGSQRFAIWAVLMSLGWFSFLWVDAFGPMFFFAAWFVGMPREELRRVIPVRELVWMTCILAAFIVGAIASRIFIPSSAENTAAQIFRHPAVIAALWALCLWLGYRGWRRSAPSS